MSQHVGKMNKVLAEINGRSADKLTYRSCKVSNCPNVHVSKTKWVSIEPEQNTDENNDEKEDVSVHFYITIPVQFKPLLKTYGIAVIFGFEGWEKNKRHMLSETKY